MSPDDAVAAGRTVLGVRAIEGFLADMPDRSAVMLRAVVPGSSKELTLAIPAEDVDTTFRPMATAMRLKLSDLGVE